MELGIEQPPTATIFLINIYFLDNNCIDYQKSQCDKNDTLDGDENKNMAIVMNLSREG